MYITKPYTQSDFAWTQWGVQDVLTASSTALTEIQQKIDDIINIPTNERTFENTLFALEVACTDFSLVESRIDFLLNVSPLKEIREQAQKVVETMQTSFLDMVTYNEKLYTAIKEYTERAVDLTGPSKKLVDDTVRGYVRLGFALPFERRTILKENNKKLQVLCNEFQKNINDYNAHIVIRPDETDGLSENYLKSLTQDAEGNFIVDITYPNYFPFIENAKRADKRKELVDLYFKKGGDRNIELLSQILDLRHKNATLLGYATYADYATEDRMAKSAVNVRAFSSSLVEAMKPGIKKDIAELTRAKRDDVGNSEAKLEYYDPSYYINQLKKSKYSIDKEKIREYFPLRHVLQQMFALYSELFSVKYEKLDGIPTWHEDVEVYAVKNLDNSLVSYFMLDLYPRDGKYGHAAEFPIVIGHKLNFADTDDTYIAPLACMVTNFPKPTVDTPSLMPHSEVETLFHEFGHVMHENLSRARFYSQSGTIVARDFVEAPSQMLENWVWDKNILKRISKHYITGEPLSDELVDKMLSAKTYMENYANMRQMVLGTFDFRLHTEDQKDRIVELYNEITTELLGIGLLPEHRWPAGFGHLAGGYGAGYYGYMWSKVYSCDMFTRFRDAGLLNREVGMEYRKKILEVGSSRDEMESVKDFLGREPNNAAFLEELGLATK